jgi:hypothetical protein
MAPTADMHALRVLGQHLDALAITVLAGDPVRAMIATGRLRRAAYRACRIADANDMTMLGHYLHDKIQPMLSLAWLVPGLTPVMYACAADSDPDEAPHLVGLQGRMADLHDTSWRSLHATDCVLDGARLRGAVLDNAVLERCTLAGVDLTGGSLRWAKLDGCNLADARLTNVAIEHARFVDCDLRRADFSVLRGALARTLRAAFVRCDLRDSRWHGRDLAGVLFLDCNLGGAHADGAADSIDDGASDATSGDADGDAEPRCGCHPRRGSMA